MVKRQFFQQLSIDETIDAMYNYDDEHYDQFYNLLFNELLSNIRNIPFDAIINKRLTGSDNPVYNTDEAHSLFWLYRADRKLIESKTIYSFRFANACHPEFYQTFETKSHHLFVPIQEPRHRYFSWYKCIGKYVLNELDRYLNIERVVSNSAKHKTKLFINQIQERLDIRFDFPSLNERIAITFEPGYPEHQ